MNGDSNSQKGFLLVEALGALVLLVIGMTTVLEAFSSAAYQARRSRWQAQLVRCAQTSFVEQVAQVQLAQESCEGIRVSTNESSITQETRLCRLTFIPTSSKGQPEETFETYLSKR